MDKAIKELQDHPEASYVEVAAKYGLSEGTLKTMYNMLDLPSRTRAIDEESMEKA